MYVMHRPNSPDPKIWSGPWRNQAEAEEIIANLRVLQERGFYKGYKWWLE